MSDYAIGFGEHVVRLAEAVGLPSDNLVNYTIEVFAGEVVTVRSTHCTTTDAINDVARVFEGMRDEGVVPLVVTPHAIPPNRLADLRLRSASGALTNAERLALAVLAGGPKGEESLDKLIDAATEEYGRGGYRVPVRVVGDKRRLKLVIKPPVGESVSSRHRDAMSDAVSRWLRGEFPAMLVPPGYSIDAYEWDDGPQIVFEDSEATEEVTTDAA